VLPILLHGDAAFAGQGSVAEVLNLSQLPGYRTGGTIHIIINNQIGFTTVPADARSSAYATDVAKMIEAPILHVNGEEPMELYWAALFALEFRQKFARDIVIDMYCYRRQGHNEADQAAFTQPVIARKIANRPTFGTIYKQQLDRRGRHQPGELSRRWNRRSGTSWSRLSENARAAGGRRPHRLQRLHRRGPAGIFPRAGRHRHPREKIQPSARR
jgi:2-oxoglutarate dehydrogenase complex dehydrogenase (E1) component-like enzyme